MGAGGVLPSPSCQPSLDEKRPRQEWQRPHRTIASRTFPNSKPFKYQWTRNPLNPESGIRCCVAFFWRPPQECKSAGASSVGVSPPRAASAKSPITQADDRLAKTSPTGARLQDRPKAREPPHRKCQGGPDAVRLAVSQRARGRGGGGARAWKALKS